MLMHSTVSGSDKRKVSQERRLIAIVDDDESVREAIRGLMRASGFAAEAFESAEHFLSSADLDRVAFLIADVNMPGMSGPELHRRLASSGKQIPTILITAYPNEQVRARAIADGVRGFLDKPFVEDDLLSCIRSALGSSAGPPT